MENSHQGPELSSIYGKNRITRVLVTESLRYNFFHQENFVGMGGRGGSNYTTSIQTWYLQWDLVITILEGLMKHIHGYQHMCKHLCLRLRLKCYSTVNTVAYTIEITNNWQLGYRCMFQLYTVSPHYWTGLVVCHQENRAIMSAEIAFSMPDCT